MIASNGKLACTTATYNNRCKLMKFNKLILYVLPLLCISSGYTRENQSIILHTDNWKDYLYYQSPNYQAPSLSAAANISTLRELNYTIRYEYMPLKRSLRFMKSGAEVCVVDKIKSAERVKSYSFSLPMNVYLSRRLYQQTFLPKLASEKINILDILRANPEHKILITSQISYGEGLDNLIAKIPKQQIVLRGSGEHSKGLLDMFSSRRAEYALLFPQALIDNNVTLAARTYQLASTPAYILGHLMCVKSPKTQDFIDQLNTIIRAQFKSTKLLHIHKDYIDSNSHLALSKYFKEIDSNHISNQTQQRKETP